MFDHLDIYTPSERWAVGLADAGLTVLGWPFRRAARVVTPNRILLLRLERIGDLLMSLGAIRAVRAQAPEATIDLVVGSWNEAVARLIAEVDHVEVLDASWLARGRPERMRRRWPDGHWRGVDDATTWPSISRATSGRTRCWRCPAHGGGWDSRMPAAGRC